MHAKLAMGASVLVLALALAGCTGEFNVRQTEPIRIQLEGDGAQGVRVEEGKADTKEIVVANPQKVEEINVEVHVTQVSDEPCEVKVIVKDEDTDEVFVERTIMVGGSGSNVTGTGTVTTGPGMGNGTTTGGNGNVTGGGDSTQGAVVVQNVFVNVKGKDNFVIVTQAVQGTADVDVTAQAASGQGENNNGTNTGNVTSDPTTGMTSTMTSNTTGY